MKLILTDIDGTILPWGNSEVSARIIAAFHAALDAGECVGPASGRSYSWIPSFFGGDASCCATALATNGLQIYYGGEKICEKTLPTAALEAARRVVAARPHAGMLCFNGATPLLVEGAASDLVQVFPDYAKACVSAKRIPAGPVVKANVFTSAGNVAHHELVEALGREVAALDVDLARPGFSNVMPAGWNKGTAVTYLRDYLGVAPEEVFVFGDAGNDLPMFNVVENSVAVGNATPEAAAAARWHIGTVDDDAVAGAIELLAAGKFPFTE